MNESCQDLKAGMKELAVLQNRLFWESELHGTRYVLPLAGREIAVVFYPGAPTDPVLFCCYGGGFIMGSAANDDACWAQLCERLGVNLFSINYRKAPEHPFPEPLYDVYDSIEYLEAHLEDFGVSSYDYSVFGFSAGGNLAAAVCLLDAQRGGALKLKRQFLCYPYLDLASSPKAKGHPESERMIYTLFPEWYCADHDPREALISPIYAVVNFSYRLAPEVKFPASLEDTNAVFAWVLDHADAYGFDTDNIFAVGDSAGGHNLMMFTALCTNPDYAREFSFEPPRGFVPRAIGLNCAAVLVVISDRPEDVFFTGLMQDYLPEGGSEAEQRLIHTLDHVTEAFPPVFLMTAEEDMLKADAMALSQKLMEKNVPFVFRYYRSEEEKLGHVFHLNVRSKEAKLCNDEECQFFEDMLDK